MKLRDLIPHLSGVRRGWQGYAAKCPAHDDRQPSLSLAESEGRILIKCFAGCRTIDILDKLNLKWCDLFDKDITKPSTITLGQTDGPVAVKGLGWTHVRANVSRIQTVYPYVDENNRLLYENVRYYPKSFKPRRYNVGGEPVWNLDGVRRVPYLLPDLIAAKQKQQDVFLCEGEKDADALRELDFAASSFKNWRPEFNTYIEGQHVIIVCDHDLPGVMQANEAAKKILPSAASVKLFDPYKDISDVAENNGLDISDYIRRCVEAEGMEMEDVKDRICMLIEGMQNWKDPAAAKPDEYFVVRSGNAWLDRSKTQPVPRMLFGELWFESELCILFADTNVGKSILAVQIADAVSRGISEESGRIRTTVPAQKVVYFDFELTAKQFESRFSERVEGSEQFVNHYQFHPNFYRAEINPESTDIGPFTKFEDFLNHALESTIASTGAKVLIIDNLTYLRDETENARNALPLMKFLKSLKSKYGLSLLALAHTPKRDSSKPLGRNDLQGSKMLINFCDSSFAIGESARQPGLRYLKQIKARNTEIIYHSENVLMANVTKPTNFLQFEFGETSVEQEHLKVISDKQRETLKQRAKEMSDSGLSIRAIAKSLNISPTSVSRYLSDPSVPGTGKTV